MPNETMKTNEELISDNLDEDSVDKEVMEQEKKADEVLRDAELALEARLSNLSDEERDFMEHHYGEFFAFEANQ